jgi:hypothetical protein
MTSYLSGESKILFVVKIERKVYFSNVENIVKLILRFFFLAVLVSELRAISLLDKYSTARTMSPAFIELI